MENTEFINAVTLEYLLNPSLYEKINNKKTNSHEQATKEILFYRRRICHLTKEMCKGNFINDSLKSPFFSYANTLVYYLKQIDEKDILQEEYTDLNLKINNNSIIKDISNNSDNEYDKKYETNKIIMNQPASHYSLDKFVKKINIKQTDRILPQQRIPDIKNPELKKKGLKKKISE